MALDAQPRSVRNRNPGNLELGINWQGLCAEQTDPPYCQFVTSIYGFRALAKDLITKWREGLKTPRAILEKYAPPTENNTEAYIQDFCTRMKCDPDTELFMLDSDVLNNACRAIAIHEAGRWAFNDMDLINGVLMALGKSE